MSRSKIFEARRIALYPEHQEIITAWIQCVKESCEEDISYDEEVQKGTLNHLIAWSCDTLNTAYSDQGKFITLDKATFNLDAGALDFINDFERTLKSAALDLGLTSAIDEDLIQNTVLVRHPFAIIKELLLRTLAKSLSKESSLNLSAEKYLNVFNNFNKKLVTLKVAFNSDLKKIVSDETYSHLIKNLASFLPMWGEMALSIIDSVKDINQSHHTIEANQGFLEQIKKNVERHLFYRLKLLLQNTKASASDLHWGDVNLSKIENILLAQDSYGFVKTTFNPMQASPDQIINILQNTNTFILFNNELYYIDKHKHSVTKLEPCEENKAIFEGFKKNIDTHYKFANTEQLQLIYAIKGIDVNDKLPLVSEHSTSLFNAVVERTHTILDILKSKFNADTNKIELIWIEKLYLAHNSICGTLDILNNLSSLSNDVGCLVFLFNIVDVQYLSKLITECHTKALAACDDKKFVEGSSLNVLMLNNDTRQKDFNYKFYNFANLDDTFKQKAKKRIYDRLINIYAIAVKLDNAQIANYKGIFKFDNYKFPTLHTNAQSLSNSTDDVSQYSYNINVITPIFAERNVPSSSFNKNCFFDALGLDRNEFIPLLCNQLKHDIDFQNIVKAEAVVRFTNTFLPVELNKVMVDEEISAIDLVLLNIKNISHSIITNIRENCQKSDSYFKYLKMNDEDLLKHLHNTDSFLLKAPSIINQLVDIQEQAKMRMINLDKIFSKPEIILSYFTHYYFDQKEGFKYDPQHSGIIHVLLKLVKIPVKIWINQEDKTPLLQQEFNISIDNNLFSRNIIFFPSANTDFTPFQPYTPTAAANKPGRYELRKFLADIVNTDKIDNIEKSIILDCFHTNNKVLAEGSLYQLWEQLEQVEYQITQANLSLKILDHFYIESIRYVLEKLKKKTVEKFTKNPDIELTAELINARVNLIFSHLNTVLVKVYEKFLPLGKENLPLILEWQGKSCWIQKEQQKFKLFKREKALFYGQGLNDKHYEFQEITTATALSSLGLSATNKKNHFADVLNTALKNEQYRQYISSEVYDYIINIHKGIFPKHGILLPASIVQLLIKQEEYEKLVSQYIDEMNTQCQTHFTTLAECLTYFTDKKSNNEEYIAYYTLQQSLIEIKKQVDTHCSELNTCEAYIKLFENDSNLWMGKYTINLYAKQKGINLNIFYKIPNTPLPMLNLDTNFSYQTDRSSTVINIVYDNSESCTFNKMVLVQGETLSPADLWNVYFEDLKSRIRTTIPQYNQNVTVSDYIALLDTSLKEPSLLTNLNIIASDKTAEIISILEQKKELVSIKHKKETLIQTLSFKTRQYIDSISNGRFASIFDLAFLIDEPMNKQKETLLFMAVKQKDLPLTQQLLKWGASVIIESYELCSIEIDPDVIIGNPNSYLLKRDSNAWTLQYIDKNKSATVVDLNVVTGLQTILKTINFAKIMDVNIKLEIQDAIVEFHKLKTCTTPLLLAANNIGFQNQQSPLFISLLLAAMAEIKKRNDDLASFNTLNQLSWDLLTPKILQCFEGYIKTKQEKIKEQSEFYTGILNLFGLNQINKRGVEIAQLLQILHTNESKVDYSKIIYDYKNIYHNSPQTWNSDLYNQLFIGTIQIAEDFIKNNNIQYEYERSKYHELYVKKKSMDIDPSQQQEEQEKLRKKIEEQDKLLAQTGLKMAELSQKYDVMAKEQQDTHETIGNLNQQFSQFATNPDLLHALQNQGLFAQTPSINIEKFVKTKPAASSTSGIFAFSAASLLTTVSTSVVNSVVAQNSWQISNGASPENFFTCLALEINRIVKVDSNELILRNICSTFEAIPKKRMLLENLHKPLKQSPMYDKNRDNYSQIKYDRDTLKKQRSGIPPIQGICAVEGVLVCNAYKLNAIYEIIIGDDNELKYAKATKDSYLMDITRDEIEQQIVAGTCPILLNYYDEYYLISSGPTLNDGASKGKQECSF